MISSDDGTSSTKGLVAVPGRRAIRAIDAGFLRQGFVIAAGALLGVVFVFALLLVVPAARHGHAASLQAVDDFGPNPGQLDMHVYRPDGQAPNAALVVALHGCLQQASGFDDETGLTALADAHGFVLLFPEQRPANNDKRCFNWFEEEHNQRDRGESGSIRSMIRHATDTYAVDPSRIFVLGLSAGGSMTAVLLANYPELFQAGAIVAGTPFGCNSPTFLTGPVWLWLSWLYGDAGAASFACGVLNAAPLSRSPEDWGDFVRAASGTAPARWPRISLWQGDADKVVHPANQAELVKQWTDVHGIDRTPDNTVEQGHIRHSVYRDANGATRLETYWIADFEHAIAVDPGPGPEQCGRAVPYIQDADICSTLKILEFWGLAP